jgi:hypothetical protein
MRRTMRAITRRPAVSSSLVRLGLLVFVAALFAGCAPGLEGRYQLSGDLDRPEYARFQGELHVDDDGKGYALLDIADQPTVRLPLCQTKRTEGTLIFDVDGSYPPGRTCDALTRTLSFRGDIGGHVLTGEVTDPEGTRLGLWRALRNLD